MINRFGLIFVLVLVLFSISSVQAINETNEQNIDTETYMEVNQDKIQKIINNDVKYDEEINNKKYLNLTMSNISVNDDNVSISFIGNDDAQGNLTLLLRNRFNTTEFIFTVNKTISLINGTGTITFNNLSVGNYSYNLIYSGDENYNSFSGLLPQHKIIYVGWSLFNIVDSISTISIENDVIYYKNGSRLAVQILDSKKSPVKRAVYLYPVGMPFPNTYLVYITVNGITYEKELDLNNATAYLNINLDPGIYQVNITFNGNPLYAGVNLTTNLTVLPTLEGKNLTKYYKNDSQYEVKVLDGQGNPLKDKFVKMNINGVFYERKTDSEGIAKLNINLNPGEYIITVYHPDTNLTFSNIITVLPTLIGEALQKPFRGKEQYKVKVLDGQGKALEGQVVSININGIIYNKTTNTEGFAYLDINLEPGFYIVTATYNGYSTSNIIKVYFTPEVVFVDLKNVG
ncbi:hypothetical protein [Methanobrevibacter sp. DSM 116169]|uniref:hypothetical protein n=1 Tax=Methanobrevibacter sp. DSM 116169 TaxID=3242727 RepID=UPI0038FC839B